MSDLVQDPASDPIPRCPWPGIADPEYARYHDEEWGVPKRTGPELFEKLILEGFQAGLSWLTILKKREAFRRAFAGFDPAVMARFGEADVARLMADASIVRNRAKIEAAVLNARALLAQKERGESLPALVAAHFPDGPIRNRHRSLSDVPSETPVSRALSRSLKARGFRFVGPTTVYAFLQASGFVNDHLVTCPRHAPCARLQQDIGAAPR